MTIAAAQVSVTTSATALVAFASSGYRDVTLYNAGSQSVFLGDSTVTITTGLTLPQSTTLKVRLGPNEALYGIVSATTATVTVLVNG